MPTSAEGGRPLSLTAIWSGGWGDGYCLAADATVGDGWEPWPEGLGVSHVSRGSLL